MEYKTYTLWRQDDEFWQSFVRESSNTYCLFSYVFNILFSNTTYAQNLFSSLQLHNLPMLNLFALSWFYCFYTAECERVQMMAFSSESFLGKEVYGRGNMHDVLLIDVMRGGRSFAYLTFMLNGLARLGCLAYWLAFSPLS